MRKIKFETGEYYHVCNRGVDKREIFCSEGDYVRFLRSTREFNRTEPIGSLYHLDKREKYKASKGVTESLPAGSDSVTPAPIIKIICYCLNPNHYHFLFKQIVKKGIEKFMHKLGLGYARYFNSKYNRSGSLYQGAYGAVAVKTGWQLNYLSAYINGNPEIHEIAKANKWPWSSYRDYMELRNGTLCHKNIILKEFKSINEYRKYVSDAIKNSREIKDDVKQYLLEEN